MTLSSEPDLIRVQILNYSLNNVHKSNIPKFLPQDKFNHENEFKGYYYRWWSTQSKPFNNDCNIKVMARRIPQLSRERGRILLLLLKKEPNSILFVGNNLRVCPLVINGRTYNLVNWVSWSNGCSTRHSIRHFTGTFAF